MGRHTRVSSNSTVEDSVLEGMENVRLEQPGEDDRTAPVHRSRSTGEQIPNRSSPDQEMPMSATGRASREVKKKVKPTGYVVIFTADPHLPLNIDDQHSWRPFKDLARMILQEKPNAMDIDPGNFKIESFGQAQAHLIGWNVRSKTAALKVMQRLIGNIWFGARLVSASLFESDGKGVTPLPTSMVPSNHPEDLGLVYRISETNIRRIEYGSSTPGVGLTTWPSSYGHSVSQQATVPLAVYPQTGMSYFNSSYPMFTTQQLQEVAQNFTQPSIGTLTPTMISSDPRSASMAYPQGQYLPMTTLPSMYDVQAHQPFPGMGPTYYANPNGALVNVAHGAHPVRSRGVFVRNLPHHAKQKHLEDFFRSAGTITHCVLNAKKKKISTAEVFFATEDEAKSAVKQFDGSTFLSRKIEVKLNSTDEALESSDSAPNTEAPLREGEGTSSRPGPIIVNGSIEGASTE